MGILKDILGEIIKVDFKPQADQNGIFNVKTAKNTYTYNLNFSTPEASRAFAEAIVAGNQTRIVDSAEKALSANSATLKVLPESTAAQFANATIVASAAAASGVEGKVKMTEGTLAFEGKVGAKVSAKSTEPEG